MESDIQACGSGRLGCSEYAIALLGLRKTLKDQYSPFSNMRKAIYLLIAVYGLLALAFFIYSFSPGSRMLFGPFDQMIAGFAESGQQTAFPLFIALFLIIPLLFAFVKLAPAMSQMTDSFTSNLLQLLTTYAVMKLTVFVFLLFIAYLVASGVSMVFYYELDVVSERTLGLATIIFLGMLTEIIAIKLLHKRANDLDYKILGTKIELTPEKESFVAGEELKCDVTLSLERPIFAEGCFIYIYRIGSPKNKLVDVVRLSGMKQYKDGQKFSLSFKITPENLKTSSEVWELKANLHVPISSFFIPRLGVARKKIRVSK